MCAGCVSVLFDQNNVDFETGSVECPVGEDDCVNLTKTTISRDGSGRREIQTLQVYCDFRDNGCESSITLKELESHKQACSYRPLACPNSARGCDEHMRATSLYVHTDEHCAYRTVACRYCRKEVVFKDEKAHVAEECLEVSRACPYECDYKALMKKSELDEHVNSSCALAPIDCDLKRIGCEIRGSRQVVLKHIKSAWPDHMRLLSAYAAKMDNIISKVVVENDFLKQNLRVVTDRFAGLEKKLSEVAVVQQTMSDMELARSLERIDNGASNQGATAIWPETNELPKLDMQVGLLELNMAEMELRLKAMEFACHSGSITWVIREYAARKQAAITNRQPSFYSTPFYSRPCGEAGYKFCGRVYLNGDGTGKSSHLSVYLVVMRGEHDNLIAWPINNIRITISLLHQNKGDARDLSLTDTLRANGTSPYQKPTTDFNTGAGSPMFACQEVVESPTYLVDDSIVIKIKVDI